MNSDLLQRDLVTTVAHRTENAVFAFWNFVESLQQNPDDGRFGIMRRREDG